MFEIMIPTEKKAVCFIPNNEFENINGNALNENKTKSPNSRVEPKGKISINDCFKVVIVPLIYTSLITIEIFL